MEEPSAKSSCEQDFFKEHDRFPKLQTANTRKIEMIQEEIGSETKFNDNNNNNVDWLKDKADGVLIRTISNIRSFYVAYEIQLRAFCVELFSFTNVFSK